MAQAVGERQPRLDIDADLFAVDFEFGRSCAYLAAAALSARSVSVPVSARR